MQRRFTAVVYGFDIRALVKEEGNDGGIAVEGRRSMKRSRAVVVSCGDVRATVKEQGGDGRLLVDRRHVQRRCAFVVYGFDIHAPVEE